MSSHRQSQTVIYPAAAVHTLEPTRARAEAVAVADGRILGVGSIDELSVWGPAAIDDRFADKVLLPGFVEAHSHSFEGALWQYTYCGYFGRTGPDGRYWPGCTSIDDVIRRLQEAELELEDPNEPLCAWGLDPIYFEGDRLVAVHLDQVSTTRPVFVLHASIHLATVNNACLDQCGIDEDTMAAGVPKGSDGKPIGELQEPPAMLLAGEVFRHLFRGLATETAVWQFGELARNAGVTTLTDLGSTSVAPQETVDRWQRVVNDPAFPARVSMFHQPGADASPEAVATVLQRRGESTDKLRFGHVKLILDGSIQGFTARLRWPGYLGDRPNGLWLIPPEQVQERFAAFHRAGITVHAHCNGDEAVDVFLDAVEATLAEAPRVDHRHTVQHCQLTSPGQYRRMAALGLSANLFANHTFFWGEQHRTITVGPDRAARMNAAATALAEGVQLSMHSDAAVTPIGSLHVAWCAVNRLLSTGEVIGPEERISVLDALRAVTIGAAYQLKMDDEIGSIAPGKLADFAVLEDDPFTVDPVDLKDIPVWGTVVGGVPHRAA